MNALKQLLVCVALIVTVLVTLSGCSVFMAARQPDAKNIELFKTGIPRSEVVAEFGQPLISEQVNGKKVEIFLFVQGYGFLNKAGRVIFHGAADFFTLGLWEIIGTPIESYFRGEETAFHVIYDNNDVLEEVNIIKLK